MNLSFTLDEKIFDKISADALIEKACENKVSALEISPDLDILALKDYRHIMNISFNQNLNINYHIPYFANSLYELENFSNYENQVKKKYLSFIDLLESFQDKLTNKPVIVMHGCNYEEGFKELAMAGTLRFVDWFLNQIDKRKLPFTLGLETLRNCKLRNTLDNREDIFFILEEFKCESLKICWDMCHDKLNFSPEPTVLDDRFLKQVVYGHIHGHKDTTGTSHISLKKSDINYFKELEKLKDINFKGTLNIELLSNFCDDYIIDLFGDIDYMKRFL